MSKRSKRPGQTTDEPQAPPPESRYRVDHYGKTRNFAAYEGQEIIAVTLYRKGAEEVTARLAEKDRTIEDLQSQLAAVRQQTTAPLPPSSAAPAQAWRPPQQLPLIAAEGMPAYRTGSPRHKRRYRPQAPR